MTIVFERERTRGLVVLDHELRGVRLLQHRRQYHIGYLPPCRLRSPCCGFDRIVHRGTGFTPKVGTDERDARWHRRVAIDTQVSPGDGSGCECHVGNTRAEHACGIEMP